jgi:hypothetical protein
MTLTHIYIIGLKIMLILLMKSLINWRSSIFRYNFFVSMQAQQPWSGKVAVDIIFYFRFLENNGCTFIAI